MLRTLILLLAALALAWGAAAAVENARIEFKPDDAKGRMEVVMDGKTAMVFRYGDQVDLPHYYPVNSPSGRSMTLQQAEPPAQYPHHRSFWFADDVSLDGGPKVSFYNALYSGKNRKDPPFANHIRQVSFEVRKAQGAEAETVQKLLWEGNTDKPYIDEVREVRYVALGNGEYFLDMKFTVTAAYGDAQFTSDAVHYAWPYIRMALDFTPTKGGTITNSEGGINQAGTCSKPAHWVDYSNTVEGATEGLTIFSHPSNGYPHSWLTRDYGCVGPRRVDEKSGTKFILKKGESMVQRVGVLIHRGDAAGGKVGERYQQYVDGKL